MSEFDLFIGVDWSGGKDRFQSGIQVAVAKPGKNAPKIIDPRNPKGWSRKAVLAYIQEQARDQQARDQRVLAGFDFAFAYPYAENESDSKPSFWEWPISSALDGYFPHVEPPSKAIMLWQMIDKLSHKKEHLYGCGVWQHPHYGDYYHTENGHGNKYSDRLRQTEKRAMKMAKEMELEAITPSPTFRCALPGQVGMGTLAGMRMLYYLADEASIWPMVETPDTNLTVVEIYPRLYFALAGVSVKGLDKKEKKNDLLAALNDALRKRWKSCKVAKLPDNNARDAADALISAAALRVLCGEGLPVLPDDVTTDARREGWIVGVDWPDKKLFTKNRRNEAHNETHQEDEEDDKE